MLGTYAETDRVLPRLLPPPGLALPLLGPLSSTSRSPYVVRPRASAPDATPPAPAGGNGPDTSSVSSSASLSGSRETNGINMPRPGIGMSLGVGAGGTMFFGGVPPSRAASLWPFASRKVRAPVVKQEREKKRILIMMSLTGGGHLASANALKAAFSEKYGDDYEIMVMDMWADYTPEPWKSFPTSYTWMVQNNVWWYMYNFMQPKFVHVPYLRLIHAMSHKMIAAHFEEVQADLIVSVHPLMQHVPLRILKDQISSGILPPTNFATVVTDWTTCANPWFHEDVTRCFVPTDYTHNLALKHGLKEEQIIQHGLPIRPAFAKPLPPKPVMKQRLSLDSNTPAVLLIGGGEGMGKMEEIVDGVAEKVGDFCQMVVCCGRNKELYAKMQAKNYASGMKVTPIGFCHNIHEYMHACDTIITKAGPGTMAECLIMGLPMILSGCIPGQEEGNIPYVVENKVGEFHPEPERIADTVRRWLGPERAEFDAMSARAKALGRPEAVYRIVEDLAKLADAPDFTYGPNRVHPQAAQFQAAAAAEAAETAAMSAAMPKLALASLSAR